MIETMYLQLFSVLTSPSSPKIGNHFFHAHPLLKLNYSPHQSNCFIISLINVLDDFEIFFISSSYGRMIFEVCWNGKPLEMRYIISNFCLTSHKIFTIIFHCKKNHYTKQFPKTLTKTKQNIY